MAYHPILLVILFLILHTCLEKNCVYVNAFNTELVASNIFDYFLESTKSLGILNGLQNKKTEINKNFTDLLKTTNHDSFMEKAFSFNSIDGYKPNDNKFNIVSFLKNMNKNQIPFESGTNLKINHQKNKQNDNLEELGRELLLNEGQ